MELNQNNFEETLFEYVEQFRVLMAPETWGNILAECSKNELLVLLLLYRKGESNMSQIAEYLNAPLNTATGIISRMENKEMVDRNRHPDDKRVVTITLSDSGRQQMAEIIKSFSYYGQRIMTVLTQDELELLGRVLDKVINLLKEVKQQGSQEPPNQIRKIVIE
ncbi:MAG: MarR family transcriptional regulator [Ruminiclostridium sp.]|nr:MarR family transcriptional regulator [Ruminiclostridium sp.]